MTPCGSSNERRRNSLGNLVDFLPPFQGSLPCRGGGTKLRVQCRGEPIFYRARNSFSTRVVFLVKFYPPNPVKPVSGVEAHHLWERFFLLLLSFFRDENWAQFYGGQREKFFSSPHVLYMLSRSLPCLLVAFICAIRECLFAKGSVYGYF